MLAINPYLDEERPSWEIRDDESTVWFARFQEYLRLGPARNIADAAIKSTKENPTADWYKVARKYDWRERAADYDNEMAKLHRMQIETAKMENQKQRITLLSKVYVKMIAAAENLDPEMISWHSFAQAFKAWIDASRTEFEPTKINLNVNEDRDIERELDNARADLFTRIVKVIEPATDTGIDTVTS